MFQKLLPHYPDELSHEILVDALRSLGTFWTFEKRNSKHATTETLQYFTFHSDSTTVISKVEGVQLSPCNLSTFSLSFWNQSGLQASCGTNRVYVGMQNIKKQDMKRKIKSNEKNGRWKKPVSLSYDYYIHTRVGTLKVETIYLHLIQNRYMFRSFTLLQRSHQHCVQPVASDVEVVGYL